MEIINGSWPITNLDPEKLSDHIGETVTLHGSIYKIRRMSGFAFVILRTSRLLIQCIYSQEFSDFDLAVVPEETCVMVIGQVVKDERSETQCEIHMKSDRFFEPRSMTRRGI